MPRWSPAASPARASSLLSLGEGDEEGAKSSADVEPGGHWHSDDDRASEYAQDEAGGYGEYVEKGDVLESGGVCGLYQDVDGYDDAELEAEGECGCESGKYQDDRRGRRDSGGEGAGGDGSVSLGGVGAVALPVGQVVDEVDCAADEAEDDGGSDGLHAED